MTVRRLTFSIDERRRLAEVCQALGTTFEEFVYHATMQALDEMEGAARALLARDRAAKSEDLQEMMRKGDL